MPFSPMSLSPSPSPSRHFGKATWSPGSLTAEAAWRGALAAVSAKLKGGPEDLAKVMVAGETVAATDVLPGALGDEGREEWLSRIREAHIPGASILFYARDLTRYDRGLFEMLLSAGGAVFHQFGLSRHEVDVELFYGEYQATPGGIHREFCANNHFVLVGRKAMYFWIGDDWIPDAAERDHAGGPVGEAQEEYLQSVAVDSVSSHGIALWAGAGEVFNWANGVWHVGMTDSGPALAINLARYMSSFDVDEAPFSIQADTDGRVTTDWLDGYRSYLADRKDAAAALAFASAYGMPGASPDREAALAPEHVASPTHAPVLWCRDSENVLVATHGRSRRFPAESVRWLGEFASMRAGEERAVPDGAQELASWLIANSALVAA
jgi:hypothetical protein